MTKIKTCLPLCANRNCIMKNCLSVFTLTVFLGLFLFSSCIKKYTCHCAISYSNAPGLPDSTYTEYDITDTKDNARSKCQAQSGNYTNNYIKTVENCYLY